MRGRVASNAYAWDTAGEALLKLHGGAELPLDRSSAVCDYIGPNPKPASSQSRPNNVVVPSFPTTRTG